VVGHRVGGRSRNPACPMRSARPNRFLQPATFELGHSRLRSQNPYYYGFRTLMSSPPSCNVLSASVACAIVALSLVWSVNAQNDLDPFMRQVLERRDQNWTKLQQYVLDERERFEVRGPTGAPLWGEGRDYTWFLRDGF